MKLLKSQVLLICTRNRASQLENSLRHNLGISSAFPGHVLIVDSSDGIQGSGQFIQSLTREYPGVRFCKISSKPGLPGQRKLGIEHILSQKTLASVEVVTFLDDDVLIIQDDYFQVVQDTFRSLPDYTAISGHLEGFHTSKLQKFHLWLAGGPVLSGKIAKSGLTSVPMPEPQQSVSQTEWCQGGMLSVRLFDRLPSVFPYFNRMYGEDVEMSHRLSEFGKLGVARDLPVKHLADISGKRSAEDVAYFTTAFRFGFRRRGGRVRFLPALYAALVLGTSNLVFGILFFSPERIAQARGYFRAALGAVLGTLQEDKSNW